MSSASATSTIDVNKRQVGGDHYKVAMEHWDWAIALGLPYLEGTATKYIARWKRKNGIEDLEKARHYLEKLIDCGMDVYQIRRTNITIATADFVVANSLDGREAMICLLIATWRNKEELCHAFMLLSELIDDLKEQDACIADAMGASEPHEDQTGQEHPYGFDPEEDVATKPSQSTF